MKIGERVGAVQKATDTEVHLYGYGFYRGDEVPIRGFLAEAGIKNPTIELDNGQIIYGFECWWGSEEKVKEMIGGRTVVITSFAA